MVVAYLHLSNKRSYSMKIYSVLFKGLSFTLLFVFLFFSAKLSGQKRTTPEKWIGIHNVYYKNRTDHFRDTVLTSSNVQIVTSDRTLDKNLSLGFHYRLIKENGRYQQFDLISLDVDKTEGLLVIYRVGDQFMEPFRGSRTKTTNLQFGYRFGKMFTVYKQLMADASVGGYPMYNKLYRTPLTSGGFPRHDIRLGFTLDLRLGLNYQIHEHLNLGYSFVPFAGQWFWREQRTFNPVLIKMQQIERTTEMQTSTFSQVLDFRNISLRYVIPAGTKKRKRRKRRRRR